MPRFTSSLIAISLAALALLGAGSAPASASEPPPTLPIEVEEAVRADAAGRTSVGAGDVELLHWEAATWQDACLELPEPGDFCAQVVTPGYFLIVQAGGEAFRYHTDEDATDVRLADRAEVDAPATTYRVQPGDTLFAIASRFGTTVTALVQANNIADPDLIEVGQRLVVEDPLREPPDAVPPGETYVVQPGDTLFGITLRFGTTVSAIAQANELTDPDLIHVGQQLVIPDGEPAHRTYLVEAGDSLASIAAGFGTTVTAIARANDIPDPDVIFPGQLLHIP